MTKNIGIAAVALVIIIGVLFSGYNNFALFQSVLGTDLTGTLFSLAGLVLFDLGAIGWALYFSHGARGSSQRATALAASVICLLLTISGAALHLLMTQTLMDVPVWAGLAAMIAIIGALAVNGISAYLVHITDPGTIEQIKIRDVEDTILTEAYRQLSAKAKEIAGQVANDVSNEMRDDAVRSLRGHTRGGNNGTSSLSAGPARTSNHGTPKLAALLTRPAAQAFGSEIEAADVPVKVRRNGTAPKG